MKNKINYLLVNFCLVMLIIFFFYKTSYLWKEIFLNIKKVVSPFLIAFVLAYVLSIFTKIFKKRGCSNTVSCLLVIGLVIIILFGVIYFTVPIISLELENIINYFKVINLDSLDVYKEYIYKNFNNLVIFLFNLICNKGINIVSSFVKFISNWFLIVILSLYFLFSMDKFKRKVRDYFSNKSYFKIIKRVDLELSNYFKSFFLIIIIESIEYIILYRIIGHPYYFLIGFLAGITTVIPYIGAMFTNVIALLSSSFVSFKLFILSVMVMVFVPIIDNYVRDPKIYCKTIAISPLESIVIFVVAISLFRVVGVIVAMPLYVVIKTIYKEIIIN